MTTPNMQPLSLERVTALFDAENWQYELHEATQTIQTGFSGIGMEIKFIAPTLNLITTVAVDTVTADDFDKVLAWVESYNYQKAFPTVTALKDDSRNLTALGAAYALPGYWEYTDTQFSTHMHTGIQSMVQVSRDFLGDFAPQVLQQLDARG